MQRPATAGLVFAAMAAAFVMAAWLVLHRLLASLGIAVPGTPGLFTAVGGVLAGWTGVRIGARRAGVIWVRTAETGLSPWTDLPAWLTWALILPGVAAAAGLARLRSAWDDPWIWLPPLAGAVAAAIVLTRRRNGARALLPHPEAPRAAPPAPDGPARPPRRFVICCDGTANRADPDRPDAPRNTNVWKLHRAVAPGPDQCSWYDPGVGTGTSALVALANRLAGATPGVIGGAFGLVGRIRTLLELALGTGITENVAEAYAEICRGWRPGDRIFLFGFSRGAYTARAVAGVIARCGILRAENAAMAGAVVRIYATRRDARDPSLGLDPALFHDRGAQARPIAFLGCFDTVGSLGVPLYGWWFTLLGLTRNRPLDTFPSAAADRICHALSMDERRPQFFPTLFDERLTPERRRALAEQGDPTPPEIVQVWFRGGHADIGGGNAGTGLSDITLDWMMARAEESGLVFAGAHRVAPRPDPAGPIHDMLRTRRAYAAAGSWPRWHPMKRGPEQPEHGFGRLHPSVFDRAALRPGAAGEPDLRFLEVGQSQDVLVRGAAQWVRSGVAIEPGATYRITWRGGTWQDSTLPPCGPDGQDDAGRGSWRDKRGWFRFRRRMPGRWMELCGTVASPRRWPLYEAGPRALLRLVLLRQPKALQDQVVRLGTAAQAQGVLVRLPPDVPAGLLWLFANDWWVFAGNNRGAVLLRITREADGTPASIEFPRPAERPPGPWA